MGERLDQLKKIGWTENEISDLLEELKGNSLPISNLEIRKEVIKLVNDLCVPCNLIGRDYIVEGISYIEQNKSSKFWSELYPHIATLYNTTSSRVERAIRHVLRRLYDRKVPLYMEIFGNTIIFNKGRNVTNSQFFCGIVKYLEENKY